MSSADEQALTTEIRRLHNKVPAASPWSLRHQLQQVPPSLLKELVNIEEEPACSLPDTRERLMYLCGVTETVLTAAQILFDDLAGLAERASHEEVRAAFVSCRLPFDPTSRWRVALLMPYMHVGVLSGFDRLWASFYGEVCHSGPVCISDSDIRKRIVAVIWILEAALIKPIRDMLVAGHQAMKNVADGHKPVGRPKDADVAERKRRTRAASQITGITGRQALFEHLQQQPEFMEFVAQTGVSFSDGTCRRDLE